MFQTSCLCLQVCQDNSKNVINILKTEVNQATLLGKVIGFVQLNLAVY